MVERIDFHTHIFPDHVAEKALQTLQRTYNAQPEGLATVAGLIEAMDEAGVERAVVCPVATRAEQVVSINRWVTGLDRTRLIPFGAIHPDFGEQEKEVEFLRGEGVRGVKLQPHFQGYELEADGTLRMIERLAGMVLVIHGGQEMSPIAKVPTTPEKLRRLHERFPEQRFVVAHLGGYQMWEGAEEYLVGQDIYFDLSFTFDKLEDQAIARIIAAHGPERVLFASDYPWQLPRVALAGLERLGLGEQERRMILGGNARRLLNL